MLMKIKYIIYILIFISITIFFIGCSQNSNKNILSSINNSKNNSQPSQKTYPDWFWKMPSSENTVYAVGYSTASQYHRDESDNNAIEDGIKNLAIYKSVFIDAESKSIRGNDMSLLYDKQIEQVSPETEESIRKNYQVQKKIRFPDKTIVLIKLGKDDESEPEASEGLTSIPLEPKWVSVLPKEPNYLYAVGLFKSSFREVDSWKIAEKKARILLAFTVEAKTKGMNMAVDYQSIIVSDIKTSAYLSDIQVVERWKDEELNICYVLVKMKDPTGVLWKGTKKQ